MLVPAIKISSDHNQTFSAPKQGEKKKKKNSQISFDLFQSSQLSFHHLYGCGDRVSCTKGDR